MKGRRKRRLEVVRDTRREGLCGDLLSHALDSAAVAELVVRDLAPEDFGEEDRAIFERLRETFAPRGKVDLVGIAEATSWDALVAVQGRERSIPLDGAFSALAEVRRRKAEREAQAFLRAGDHREAAAVLSRIGAAEVGGPDAPGRVTDAAIESFLTLQESNRQRGFLGPKTGLRALDRLTLGMAAASVWAVAGATSAGKSTLLSQAIVYALLEGASVAIFSLEMPVSWTLARLIGAYVQKNPTKIFMGNLSDTERSLVRGTLEIFRESRLHIFRDQVEISDICATARKLKAAHGRLDIVAVDFIQNVGVRDALSQVDRMATAATELGRLAGEIDACVLVASQLSNEAVREKGSGILSFRYAAELAHAADVALELVPKTDGMTVDLLLRKNRSGQLGRIALSWAGEWSRFEEVSGK